MGITRSTSSTVKTAARDVETRDSRTLCVCQTYLLVFFVVFFIKSQLGIKSILLYKLCRAIFICDSVKNHTLIRVDLGQNANFFISY